MLRICSSQKDELDKRLAILESENNNLRQERDEIKIKLKN